MGWTALSYGMHYLSAGYEYGMNHPEAVLFAGLMLFLLLRRKFRAMLILTFGVTLCFANYFVLAEYNVLLIPPVYAAGFAGISIVLLLLLVFQFIHTT